MDKLDLINFEFGGLTLIFTVKALTVKILIGIIVLILMAATAFGMCFAYNNWVKWTRKEENKNKLTALRAHLQQANQVMEDLEKELLLETGDFIEDWRSLKRDLEFLDEFEEILQAIEKRIPDAAATSERSSL